MLFKDFSELDIIVVCIYITTIFSMEISMIYKGVCRVFVATFFSLVVLLALPACAKKVQKKPFVPTVTVTAAQTVDLAQVTNVVGQITPIESVELRARVQGYLVSRNFEAGAFVKKGQLLFQIQKDQYKADVELAVGKDIEALAQLDYANIEYNRYNLLLKQNAASQDTFDQTAKDKYQFEGALREAKANLTLANLNLSYTDIYAPFDGRIGMYTYSVGDLVGGNSKPLAEVIMTDPIWVEFNYSESVFLKILQQTGKVLPTAQDPTLTTNRTYVKLTLPDGSLYPLEGKIDFINNKIDPETGTIQMKARFDNPNQLLIAGGYVHVQIGMKTKTPELIIPQAALQEDQAGNFVFVVNNKDVIEKRYITTGTATSSNIVVTKGLSADELVVTQGILLVRSGSTVKYVIQEQSSAVAQPQPASSASDTSKRQKN